MATRQIDTLDNIMDTHPSLSASLEDFENSDHPSPEFRIPSHHSGFRSEDSEAESHLEGPWSPNIYRRPDTSNEWYRHQPFLPRRHHLQASKSPRDSRESSPRFEDAREDDEDYTLPANIPLPRGSLSPEKQRSPSPQPSPVQEQAFAQGFEEREETPAVAENLNNCTISSSSI
jgi:hypothetical protein